MQCLLTSNQSNFLWQFKNTIHCKSSISPSSSYVTQFQSTIKRGRTTRTQSSSTAPFIRKLGGVSSVCLQFIFMGNYVCNDLIHMFLLFQEKLILQKYLLIKLIEGTSLTLTKKMKGKKGL